jgi:hypothetical protein
MRKNAPIKTCICGLDFAVLDFMKSRVRGYCSHKCRIKTILEKIKDRQQKLGKNP